MKFKFPSQKGRITVEKNGDPILHSPIHKTTQLMHKGKETIVENIIETTKIYGSSKPVFGFRKIIKTHETTDSQTGKKILTYEHGDVQTIHHESYLKMTQNLAIGICKLLKKKRMMGICMSTCFEWILATHAAHFNSSAVVTCYVKMGEKAIISIINETELETMVCEGKMISFFEGIAKDCPSLKNLICIGKFSNESKVLNCYEIENLIKQGKEKKDTTKLEYPKPDDLAFIIYTSGTTGKPKGVLHQHSSICYACKSLQQHFNSGPKDRHLSYLPLAHIFEIMGIHANFFQGSYIGFGKPRTLLAKEGGAKYKGDLELVQPTMLPVVPRVLSTIKKGIEEKLKHENKLKVFLFNLILQKRIKSLRKGKLDPVLFQNFVFKKIINLFGGKLKILVSGGAPLEKSIQEWFQAILYNVSVSQGYGLTETLAILTSELPENGWRTNSSVGEAMEIVKIKLKSIPELKYKVENMEGEILVSGKNIFQGYYKNEELTKEVFEVDKNGVKWFCTGDIGRINKKDKTLTLIDRKKSLVKLSNGEYVSPQELEMIYEVSPIIQPNGIFVHVDPSKDYPIAICLIQKSFAKEFAKENGNGTDLEKTIKSKEFKLKLLKSLDSIAETHKKSKDQLISNLYCEFAEWTPENGLTTAAFKLKRKALQIHYSKIIDQLYDEKR